ncbi:MAG: leucine-rich repeat protein, partial [Clostridia bacterium]|nr:leucine-rich repeat protein [Clostridia bacterium]
MIKKTKLMLALAFILVMSSVLLITASAESLWDAKPTTAPVDYGYCLDWDGSKAVDTNIKWEIHNLGAADAPSYAIYYYIDDTVDSDNKLLSSQMNKEASVTADNNSYGYNSTAQEIYSKHPWYNAENPDIFKNIKTIVIGDNIEGFKNGAFAAMYTVTTIEMPASLVSMDGAAFKNMTALSSVYTRGVNEAETGFINLRNLTSINMNINYIFCGLKQATKYVWNENLTLTSTATKNSIGWQGFCNNTKLTSIDLPDVESLTSLGSYTFQGCSILKEITIPGSYTTINANVFSNCTVLEKINCEIGTAAFNFAEQYGYLPHLIELIPEATEATPTGYCLDWVSSAATSTNVKWELHNLGTADAPNYTLYFYIDKSVDSTNTLLSSQMNKDLNATNNVNGYGYGNEGVSVYSKHPWYDENTISLIKNIVIADGITGLKNGAFAGMTSVEKVEMPKTLTTINGAVFKGMTNLSSVYTRGVNEAEEGIINLENITEINFGGINYGFRGLAKVKQYIFNENVKDEGYAYKRISQAFFAGNTSLTSIDLSGVTNLETIRTQAFLNCSSLTEIRVSSTITSIQKDDAFSGCTSLKAIYAPVGSVVHSYAMSKGYETTHTIDVYGTVDSVENVHCATLTFDPEEKHATAVKVLESGWWEFDPYENADIRSFMTAYKDYAVSFTFEDNFSKIRSYHGIFNGFTKLESVCFAAGQRLVDWWGNGGIFSGCTALTTVYFGDETEIKAGVADFSGMGIWAEDKPAIFTKALFQNCTSLTEVILPSLNNTGYTNSSGTYVENDPIIYTTTFEGCTALRSLTVPSTFDAIESGAFSTCASLTTLNYSASIDLITGDTVTGTIGLVIYCDSEEYAKEVNAALKTADVPTSQAFAFYMPGMKSELYYSVRDKIKVTENDDGTTNTVNNGLRTIFSFNETAPEGYTLVEYGSLSATKDTWSGYTENFGGEESVLQLSENGEFITPSKIVKTPIYN